MKLMRTNILGYLFITIVASSACSGEDLVFKAKFSGSTLTTTNGPGNSVVSTEHTHALVGNDGTLTLKCKHSDTKSCHYRAWQVTSRTQDSTGIKLFEQASFFVLALGETKVLKPALEGSSFCHASDKLPDPIACMRTRI